MPTRVRYPSISFIAARSCPGDVIGRDNEIPWRLGSDLRRFRRLTTGHAVVMGRRTFDSIGRVLPDRANIVLSREFSSNGAESSLRPREENLFFASDEDAALYAADLFSIIHDKNDIFVIGGQNIYQMFETLVDRVHLTLVFANVAGDAFFHMKFPCEEWRTLHEEDFPASDIDKHASKYILYERRERRHRHRLPRSLHAEPFAEQARIAEMLEKHEKAIRKYEASHQEEFDLDSK